jgi:CRISPR-associated protein Csx3
LIIIAELQSVLHDEDRVDEKTPVLRGVISKLERQHPPHGLMVQTLSERLRHLFAFSPEELKERLFPRAPTEFIVDLDRLARSAGTTHWQPSDLSRILREIPLTTCSIYERGPNWLYAALASHIAPEPVFLFNPLLGWVRPPSVVLGDQPSDLLQWTLTPKPSFTWLEANPAQPHLDYDELRHVLAPALDPQHGVILSGKLPLWLLVGLALAYRQHPWLAIVQAQDYTNGIVFTSKMQEHRPGSLVVLRGNR